MSKAEQEAIELLKKTIKNSNYCDSIGTGQIEILLNYIDKLQKENDFLKAPLEYANGNTLDKRYVESNFISKDKIRNKIKELEETTAKELRYNFLMNRDEVKSAFIRILEELLN